MVFFWGGGGGWMLCISALILPFQTPSELLCKQLGFQVLQRLDAKGAIHTHEMEAAPSAPHPLGDEPDSPH